MLLQQLSRHQQVFAYYILNNMGMEFHGTKKMGISLPAIALYHHLYLCMKANADGRLGFHAFIISTERLGNHYFLVVPVSQSDIVTILPSTAKWRVLVALAPSNVYMIFNNHDKV